MLFMTLQPPRVFLVLSYILSAYLTDRCWAPPNKHPSNTEQDLPQDAMAITAGGIRIKRLLTRAMWASHILMTIFYPSPPVWVCPNPDNMSDELYVWSQYVKIMLACIVLAAPIRLLAFRHLGRNFTFRLVQPQKLVTTGLYAYVQHPSYPTNWLVSTANMALLMRLDGALGCVLPGALVKFAMKGSVIGLWPAFLIMLGLGGLYGIWARVKDEETMLRTAFGTQWEEYNLQTKRFLPGIF